MTWGQIQGVAAGPASYAATLGRPYRREVSLRQRAQSWQAEPATASSHPVVVQSILRRPSAMTTLTLVVVGIAIGVVMADLAHLVAIRRSATSIRSQAIQACTSFYCRADKALDSFIDAANQSFSTAAAANTKQLQPSDQFPHGVSDKAAAIDGKIVALARDGGDNFSMARLHMRAESFLTRITSRVGFGDVKFSLLDPGSIIRWTTSGNMSAMVGMVLIAVLVLVGVLSPVRYVTRGRRQRHLP
jgi:hypothetical protein